MKAESLLLCQRLFSAGAQDRYQLGTWVAAIAVGNPPSNGAMQAAAQAILGVQGGALSIPNSISGRLSALEQKGVVALTPVAMTSNQDHSGFWKIAPAQMIVVQAELVAAGWPTAKLG